MSIDSHASAETGTDPAATNVVRDRLLLLVGALAGVALFWGVARQMNIPAEFSASLLQQPSPDVVLAIVIVTFLAAVALGAVIAGSVGSDAGLFCASIGLATLSALGRPMRYTLFEAPSRSIYLVLSLELLLLGAGVALGWWALHRWAMRRRGLEHRDTDARSGDWDQKLFAMVAHAAVMVSLVSFLARSDAKAQVLAAVFSASFLGTLIANYVIPAGPSLVFCVAPVFVGILGYIGGYFTPAGMEIGRTGGYFAALARPLPLDYASLGTAGGLLGYWTSVRWHANDEPTKDSP